MDLLDEDLISLNFAVVLPWEAWGFLLSLIWTVGIESTGTLYAIYVGHTPCLS